VESVPKLLSANLEPQAAMSMPTTARMVVLSGPSGAGKSTVLRRLLERYPDQLRLSVSATTRPPRPGEVEGRDYHFLTAEEFARRREAGEFLECFEVFGRGQWYGTLLGEVAPSRDAKKAVVLDIDVEGAAQVLGLHPEVPSIFLRPNSMADLEHRLRARGTEGEEAIQRRLEVARRELQRASHYQFEVINDTVDEAVDQISRFLRKQGIVT